MSKLSKLTAIMVAACICLTSVPMVSMAATPKLSEKKVTIVKGKKKTIKLKNAKKAKWSVVKGKKVISVKFTSNKAVITGKKKGSAKICARIGKTKLYCNIKVKTAGESIKPETPVEVITDGTEVSTGDFAVNLLKGLREKDKTNTLISPDSIMTALVMAGYGAAGTTKTAMEEAMGVSDIDKCGVFFGTLHKRLAQSKSYYRAADSIWIKKDEVVLLDPFVEKNKNVLSADIYEEPFSDETIAKINAWVSDNTKKMIPEIIDKFDEDDVMILLNAVCFEGSWMEPYEKYQIDENGVFTTAAGKEQKAAMLNGHEENFIECEGATGFVKYYSDGKFAFMALLPPEGISVDSQLAKLSGEKLIKAFKDKTYASVTTKIPEFSYDYSALLNDQLKNMGMGIAFTNFADFSNIADYSKLDYKNMRINKVIHKTHIELDKNGTKAAAATSISMGKASSVKDQIYKTVILDRPFIYSIIDTATGMPLFLGTVDELK